MNNETKLTGKVFKNFLKSDKVYVFAETETSVYWVWGTSHDDREQPHMTYRPYFLDRYEEVIEYNERIHSHKLENVAGQKLDSLLFYVFGVIESQLPQHQVDLINKEIEYYAGRENNDEFCACGNDLIDGRFYCDECI